jgi:CRP-like cAMP-binding protein
MNFDEKTITRIRKILSTDKDNRTRLDLEYLIKNLKFEYIKHLLEKYGETIVFTFLKSIYWKEFKKDEYVYKTGEYSNNCYFLIKGSVDYCTPLEASKSILKGSLRPARNKRKIEFSYIRSIYEGSLFGETEIAERKNRTYTAICTSYCIVGEMSKNDYISIFENTKRLEINEEMKFLNSTQLFLNSNGNSVRKFLLELDKKLFKHGDLVVRQGDTMRNLLIIRKGQFEVIYKHTDNFKCEFNSKYLHEEEVERFTSNRAYELRNEINMVEPHKV